MKDNIKTELDAIFQKKNEATARAERARSEKEDREAAALQQFTRLAETVIKPSMEQFAAYLKEKGHGTLIWTDEEKVDNNTRHGAHIVTRAGVTMRISADHTVPYRGGGQDSLPHFSVFLEKYKGAVFLHECTMLPGKGGQAGSCGEVKLGELTTEILEAAIAKTIAKTFN